MTEISAEERLLEILSQRLGRKDLTLDSSITADAGLDSVSVMDFVLDLEDEFDTTVPLDQLSDVHTIRELGAVIDRLRQPGPGKAQPASLTGHTT